MNDMKQSMQAYEVNGQIVTEESLRSMKRDKLDALYDGFAKMRDKWVQHRAQSAVERRWRKASQLYYGDQGDASDSDLKNVLKNGPQARTATSSNRSKIVVNIVRPKVDQAIARMCEILLPVDDRNWAIKPTPIPETIAMIGDPRPTVDPVTKQPTGLTADDEAAAVLQVAKESSEAMQRSIDDDLTECHYNGELRRVVSDGVRLGTGIIKGPFPSRRTHKVWSPASDGSQQLIIESETAPASVAVDPWDVFVDPACGNNHQRGRGVFERRLVTRKELRALVKIDGYDPDAIRAVLREAPRRVRVAEGRVTRQAIEDESYELWEYHGEVEPEDFQCLQEVANGDPIEDVDFAVLIIVNERVIGAMPSWVPDRSVPYDFWCYRGADDSPYGHGLPEELAHQQSVVNSAWRQVMDNSSISAGGQTVMKRGQVIPANGNYDLEPRKLWFAKDDMSDVRQAFTVFEFQSHAKELLEVAQAAMNFADVESSLPQILSGSGPQGGGGGVPETVGGMIMLFNNATAVLRQRVKLFDDTITQPHIGRYYDFKMANDPDPKIKGDFEIDARGSSALVERDIQNQAMLNLANITNLPRYAPHMKEREELKAILKAFKANPEDMMKTEDQVAKEQQNQQPPSDPRIEAAKIQAQSRSEEAEVKRQALAYNIERERAEGQQAVMNAQLQRELKLADLATKSQDMQAERDSRERLETLKIEDGRQQFNAEMAVKVRQGSGI